MILMAAARSPVSFLLIPIRDYVKRVPSMSYSYRRASTGSNRAALLAKADLVTAMVGEFPELQGFLEFWQKSLEGVLHSVTVAHCRLIKPAEIKPVDGLFRLH